MKSKVVLNALALLFAAGAMAQDCTFFFPQTKGTQLVKKGYDAKGNLQNVMTYTVDEVKNIPSGLEVEADYVFKNSAGTVYDKGDLEAFYDREYVTTEQVATPAGTFDCTKIKYKIKSRSPKETIEGYGYEWYAPNVGVVKNEQYNNNNQLQYYTVLEVVK